MDDAIERWVDVARTHQKYESDFSTDKIKARVRWGKRRFLFDTLETMEIFSVEVSINHRLQGVFGEFLEAFERVAWMHDRDVCFVDVRSERLAVALVQQEYIEDGRGNWWKLKMLG